jgi:hypothetical protein
MAVDNKHPDYLERAGEWAIMRHTARGAKAVKEQGETYLPMPSGFRAQADAGKAMYGAYSTRAQFPEIVTPSISGMVGIIHRSEAQIKMPKAMEGLWEKATKDGLPLEALHRRVTGELLLMGRYGLLVDAASTGSDLPWLAGYSAEALINWTPERDLFVLDETGPVRSEFEWTEQQAYRVLRLIDGRYLVETYKGTEKQAAGAEPRARANKPIPDIPFVVLGSRDLSVTPDDPPLIGVARAALAAYRLDADYRHQLYSTGQETAVVINGDAPTAVGSGVVLSLKGEQGLTPDFKYVGPSGVGIDAHRRAIQDERDNAAAAGARLFDSEKKAAESGDALRIRYAAQTATLTSIAQASAAGIEKALRYVAIMIGASPDEVVVTPNLSFMDSPMAAAEAKALMEVWKGGGISYQTYYENLQRGQIASVERDHEDEKALVAEDQEGLEPEETIDPATGLPVVQEAPPVAA